MDVGSMVGLLLIVVALAGGQLAVGGSLLELVQGFALLVVPAGAAGAALVGASFADVSRALRLWPGIFAAAGTDLKPVIDDIIRIANLARKEGLLAIEGQRASVRNDSLKRALKFVTDGFEPATVREILDAELAQGSREEDSAADVLERAARGAVHAGVLGLALALAYALTRLPSGVPAAVSAAAAGFWALVYGYALGPLVLAPSARKLRALALHGRTRRELVRLGVLGILEGQNPTFLQEKLQVLAGR
jgi:chemotaxis protein MotA